MLSPPVPPPPSCPQPAIGDYGVIGDCRSIALVARDGALDWLCWPRFDSPALFAALLDEAGGHWRIAPRDAVLSRRRYLDQTNVLEATFGTGDGTVTLIDFMPVAGVDHARRQLSPETAIVRIVRCTAGRASIDLHYAPRPDFARRVPRLIDRGRLGV